MAQQDNRRFVDLFDQHERKWGAVIEVRTGHRVGPPHPVKWSSPMTPPDKYIDHDASSPFRIIIAYERWARDSKTAFDDYEERRRQVAMAISAQGTISDVLKANPPELRDIVGPPPGIAPVIAIQAAKAGNPWILYGEGDPPAMALELDFFAEYRPGYAEAAWQNRKDAKVMLPDVDPFAAKAKGSSTKAKQESLV